MDRIRELRAFVAIVEKRTMAEAAAEVQLTPSAISKLLKRLETTVGVRLVSRTTRQLVLTSEGETFYEHARTIIDGIDALDAILNTRSKCPSGTLRISCGVAFGLHGLCPVLPEFADRFPDIHVELSLTDRIVDLVNERIDVAVRAGVLKSSTLIQRKISEIRRVICASPDYLRAAGTPMVPGDLASHRIVVLSGISDFDRWPFYMPDGRVRRVSVTPNLVADNAEAVLELGLAGGGIVRLGDNLTRTHLDAGRLIPVLEEQHHTEALPISLVYLPGMKHSPRVRAFLDFVIEKFVP
ncbi:MAG: LysR family transcriptional regulator [Hyphomicrobiaceae bacterium]